MKRKIKMTALAMAMILSASTAMSNTMIAKAEEMPTVMESEVATGTDGDEVIDVEVEANMVELNATNFPDANFRKFLKENYDADNDNMIDANSVEEVNVDGATSIKGIELFINLKWLQLDEFKGNNINISQNRMLQNVSIFNAKLNTLDVSKNTELETLDCSNCNLTTLDISNNKKLKSLNCSENKISKLNFNNNVLLESLVCYDNPLNNIDVSMLGNLTMLHCGKCNLSAINLNNNKKLNELYCYDNPISSLDLNQLGQLNTLGCSGTNMKKVDVSKNKNLTNLYMDGDMSVDLTGININWLDISLGKTNGEFKFDKIKGYKYDLINDPGWNSNTKTLSFDPDIETSQGITAVFYDYYVDMKDYSILNLTADEYYFKDGKTYPSKASVYVKDYTNAGCLAGLITDSNGEKDLEYSWYATADNGNSWTLIQDWKQGSALVHYQPEKYGDYIIVGKARVKGDDSTIVQAATNITYHPHIKGICQMPYEGPGGGYLIGIESFDDYPYDVDYKYEMLILDCTLLAQGKDAWIYTTGKCYGQDNCLWTVWQPQYGYYWTLFRIFDGNDNLIDEACYGFVNAY